MSINNWLVGFSIVNVLFTGQVILTSVEEENKSVEFAFEAYSMARLIGVVKFEIV